MYSASSGKWLTEKAEGDSGVMLFFKGPRFFYNFEKATDKWLNS